METKSPCLDGRKFREICLGSEGYAIRIEGPATDHLCRHMIDLTRFPFAEGKAIAEKIVRAVNHHEELMEIARAVKRFDSFTACGEVEAVSKEARSLLDRIEKGGDK